MTPEQRTDILNRSDKRKHSWHCNPLPTGCVCSKADIAALLADNEAQAQEIRRLKKTNAELKSAFKAAKGEKG